MRRLSEQCTCLNMFKIIERVAVLHCPPYTPPFSSPPFFSHVLEPPSLCTLYQARINPLNPNLIVFYLIYLKTLIFFSFSPPLFDHELNVAGALTQTSCANLGARKVSAPGIFPTLWHLSAAKVASTALRLSLQTMPPTTTARRSTFQPPQPQPQPQQLQKRRRQRRRRSPRLLPRLLLR